jgi:lysophospholipase L1-like esterase
MMRSVPRKLLYGTYLAIVSFVLAETAVRFSGYARRHLCDPIYQSFAGSAQIPYIHKPNLHKARARGLAVVDTDAMGLRSLAVGEQCGPHQNGEFRIALVGDSVTFGEGVVRTEETFAQILEQTLNRRQQAVKARVFNFGASAYSVQVMAATLRHRMLTVEPDLVMMAIIPSDFDLDRTPAVDSRGYLTDNKLSGFLSRDSVLRPWLRKVHLLYLGRDLIYPRLDKTKKAEEILAAGQLPASYSYLNHFRAMANEHGVPYRLVLLPSLKSRFHNFSSHLRADDLAFVDLEPLREKFTEKEFRASPFDTHPSAAAHRAIGEALAENILPFLGKEAGRVRQLRPGQ